MSRMAKLVQRNDINCSHSQSVWVGFFQMATVSWIVRRVDFSCLAYVLQDTRYHCSVGCVGNLDCSLAWVLLLLSHQHPVVVMQRLVLTVTAKEYIWVSFRRVC